MKFYHYRGLAASRIGRSRQWIEDLTTALKLARSVPGVPHDAILTGLSVGEAASGRYADAVRHRREALNAIMGPANSGRRIVLHGSLAFLNAGLGDLPAAEGELRAMDRLLPELLKWEDRTWVRDTQAHGHMAHARVLEYQGRYRDAERRFREALGEVERDTPKAAQSALFYDHATTRILRLGDFHSGLARVLTRQGRLAEAEVEARHALRVFVERFGRDSPYTVQTLVTFAEILTEQGRFAEAETVARVAVGIYERIGASQDSLGAAQARRALADALLAQERWPEALAEFDAIERTSEGTPGPSSSSSPGTSAGPSPSWRAARPRRPSSAPPRPSPRRRSSSATSTPRWRSSAASPRWPWPRPASPTAP